MGIPIGSSDHDSIEINIIPPADLGGLSASYTDVPINPRFDWSKSNWAAYSAFCSSIDLSIVFKDCQDADAYWNAFDRFIQMANKKFVPFVREAKKPKMHKSLPPRVISNLINKKHKLWRSLKKFPTIVNRWKYKQLSSRIKFERKRITLEREKTIILSQKIGSLYRHINARLTHKTGIAPLLNKQGHIVSEDADKAEILNLHFVQVGTKDDGNLPPFEISKPLDISISNVYFDSEEIHQNILKLKTDSSPGPDEYPPILLKSVSKSIAYPLAMLFRLIFQSGKLPSIWKRALVRPLFKKGNSSEPNNYRPISLTSVVCKLMKLLSKNNCCPILIPTR